jgi:hypothetical protein
MPRRAPVRIAISLSSRAVVSLWVLSVVAACGEDAATGVEAPGLEIRTATVGAAAGAGGYEVGIDGAAARPIGVTDTLLVGDIAAGSHAVTLAGLAAECAVSGENPRLVSVVAGSTATVEFAVTCLAPGARLEVTTATSGMDPDPDGYELVVDGVPTHPVDDGAAVTLDALPSGPHTLALAGVAENCRVAGDNPRTVTLDPGASASTDFAVACISVVAGWNTLALPEGVRATGLWAAGPADIYVTGRDDSPNGGHSLVLHYDGTAWAEQFHADDGDAFANVWGLSPTQVFAFGLYSLARYDGSRWTLDQGASTVGPIYGALWGSSPTDLFAAGSLDGDPPIGLINHYDGVSWSWMHGHDFTYNGRVNDISGTAPTDVYAVGGDYDYDAPPDEKMETDAVVHFDGTAWSRSFEDTRLYGTRRYEFSGVWANAHDDVFVVATDGRILHFDGTAWTGMVSPTSAQLLDVWGASRSEVYAVGDAGILRYDGTAWAIISRTAATRVWGTAADLFVAVDGAILHRAR